MDWYQLDAKEVFRKLTTSEHGLTGVEASKRLSEYGPNQLAEEQKVSKMKILVHQFTSPLIYILFIAAVVTGLLREYIDTGVILAVILLNAIIGYIQEFKAERSVRALKKMVVPKARVVRDGDEREISSVELVPGDIVLLASGAKVPADLRLFKGLELRIDESILTGESIPAEKVTAGLPEENLTFGDQDNMSFMGTVVVNGRGRGIVVATGPATVLGRIAQEVKEVGPVKAPIQEKIASLAKRLGTLVAGASLAVFLIGLLRGESIKEMAITAIAVAVATIPEGLPIVVTVALAIGVVRMARRNAIVRTLPTVETLGSTTVIGSDKTGTLTRNEMTVRLFYDGERTYEITGSGYQPKGEILLDKIPVGADKLEMLHHVFRIGLLCNESDVYEEYGQYKVEGDPTEAALIVAAMKAGLNPEEERRQYPQLAIIPFESDRGYMATLHQHNGKKVVFAKGSLERLLDICTECMVGEDLKRSAFFGAADSLAQEGLRVLAMAYKEVPEDVTEITHRDVETDLVFAGLQGMMDPPRDEAIKAIEGCKRAGIRTVMITGDHAVTAQAIATKLGIIEDNPHVLTGKELETMTDEDLFAKAKDISVYARVAPQHKLRIVEQFKKHGDIVAVTGDGVNDAPALKAAHVGIAMGKGGTDVAKEAADMIVTDDNFASIFHAVAEGRVVFDNIRKAIFFLLPTGLAAVMSIIATMLLGLPIPYVPAQLLWINLVTNGLQDVALAFEPGEEGIIERPPKDPKEGILSRLLIERTILVGTIISIGVVFNYVMSIRGGDSIEQARTVAVTTMVFFQFFQAWNSRSEFRSVFHMSVMSNPFLFFSMIGALFAHLAVLYVPALQWVFRTVPISITEWLEILSVASIIVIVVEIDKWVRRRKVS
jgi:magnesium-transporting ATPase (P-type)